MSNKKRLNVIGLMSGTTFDGVDAAFLHTNGDDFVEIGQTHYLEYPAELRKQIDHIINDKPSLHEILTTEKDLTIFHSQLVLELLNKMNKPAEYIDLIGFHGQTIYHDASSSVTWQIGNGQLLAQITQINVINDFRRKDMSIGGCGAPLVPIFHEVLVRNLPKPVAFLNIGGVANLSYIGQNGQLIAFDTGPGCALIDDLVKKNTNLNYDKNGQIARSACPDLEFVEKLLEHKFFSQNFPKALDRNDFKTLTKALDLINYPDAISTLTHLTAASIASSLKILPQKPAMWLVSGGGSRNQFLLEILEKNYSIKLQNVQDALGLNPDFIEAWAFAYLAARSFYHLPISFPNTTGCKKPTSGGCLHLAL